MQIKRRNICDLRERNQILSNHHAMELEVIVVWRAKCNTSQASKIVSTELSAKKKKKKRWTRNETQNMPIWIFKLGKRGLRWLNRGVKQSRWRIHCLFRGLTSQDIPHPMSTKTSDQRPNTEEFRLPRKTMRHQPTRLIDNSSWRHLEWDWVVSCGGNRIGLRMSHHQR